MKTWRRAHATSRSDLFACGRSVEIVVRARRADSRFAALIDFETTTIMLTTPVAISAIPKRKKGNPLTHEVPPPVFALRVHAESSVCDAPITQRPTAAIPTQRINVTDLFMTHFYHWEDGDSWQSPCLR